MVLIFSTEITSRSEYTFRLIFEDILRIRVIFTTNLSEFISSELPKMNYSHQRIGEELFLFSGELLFMKGTTCPEFNSVEYMGEKYFMETSADSFLPFDPFAATFFLVTRLEEYTATDTDQYGRYRHEDSILYKNRLLHRPVVNVWAGLIAEKLKERFPLLEIPEKRFSFISTIDIDSAWSYLCKGFFRNTGGLFRDLLKADIKEAGRRLKVHLRLQKDPFDTYQFIEETFGGNEDRVIWFFLLGNYSRYDKNISHRNPALKNLIRKISKKYKIGIHPSLKGSIDDGRKWFQAEKKRLEEITHLTVRNSRQHYLYMKIPDTYQVLTESGITADFTMGYPGSCGFRAGICTPFLFYDITNEQVTKLAVYPLHVMDVTLNDYNNFGPDEAWETIRNLMNEVKMAGGTFVGLWHNESLTNEGKWEGYRDVFKKMNQTGFLWANE